MTRGGARLCNQPRTSLAERGGAAQTDRARSPEKEREIGLGLEKEKRDPQTEVEEEAS